MWKRTAIVSFSVCLLAALACRTREPSTPAPPSTQGESKPAHSDLKGRESDVLAEPEPDAFHHLLSVPSSGPVPVLSDKALADAVRRSNMASFTLWSAFARTGNFVASPYNIRAALGLVYLAAEGSSRERLRSRLLYPALTDELAIRELGAVVRASAGARFAFASSLWIARAQSERLRPPYRTAVADWLPGEVHGIGFDADPERARQLINAWVSEHTGHSQADATELPVITSNSQAVLVDTGTFTGTLPDGRCKAIRNGPVEAALADYPGSSLSFVVLKPRAWKRFTWNEKTFSRVWAALQQRAPEVGFHLSPFKLRSEHELKQPLQLLEIPLAEPSLLQGAAPTLHLDQIVHKASIDMEAEPAQAEPKPQTPVKDQPLGHTFTSDQPDFFVDRAFYFLVVERVTGLILLMGQVVEPTVSQ